MQLADQNIQERLAEGDLVIEPLDDPDLQIQPATVDVRLGNKFLKFQQANIPHIDPLDDAEVEDYVEEIIIDDDEQFILHPDEFVLGTTIETVGVPDDLKGQVEGRSSLGRLALVVHATAGVIDPGFKGQITLELSNLGKAPVALTPGMRIAQLEFIELKDPAERPYGEERGSKYQGQEGPVASRITGDPDI
ncbi:dCTP deaminase [Salinibaculum rarum]|uniref:dCTP deaminase n=1 Tax=Salinibaculum rarum TaxID=3058903 RepID=UPI00265E961B|nr:dCTP deaminase [Salinibaculum sp. KK48]